MGRFARPASGFKREAVAADTAGRGPHRMNDQNSNPVALALSIVLYLAVAVAVGAVAHDGSSDAYELGRAFGAGLAGLLVAAVVRLVYVRLTPWGRGKPEVAPALFVLAAAIGAISILPRIGDEDDVYVDSAEECVASEPSPFAAQPRGIEFAELPPARRAQLEESFAAGVSSGLADHLEAKTLVSGGRPIGYAVAIPGMPEAEFDEFEAGFTDSVVGQGGSVEHATIAGEDVLIGETAASVVVAGLRGCYALSVGAVDRQSSKSLARLLLRG
jgi:hypothetical protein